ncbi:MAG: pilin, partial [Betaproteobacteria bacterium]
RRRGFTLLEMAVVLAIIAILALMAVPSYIEKFVKDQIVEALPLADLAKGPVAASWSATQILPDNNEGAGLPPADKIVSNFVRSVQVQNGAIHVTFGNRASSAIKDKILTLRPAVVADAPVVPVAWVCGDAAAPDRMTVKGENKTNIETKFLPLKCRKSPA